MPADAVVEVIGAKDIVVVRAERREVRAVLKDHGGRARLWSRREWRVPFVEIDDLAPLFRDLADLGVVFRYEPGGWPPAAVADLLVERGLLREEGLLAGWGLGSDDVQVHPLIEVVGHPRRAWTPADLRSQVEFLAIRLDAAGMEREAVALRESLSLTPENATVDPQSRVVAILSELASSIGDSDLRGECVRLVDEAERLRDAGRR